MHSVEFLGFIMIKKTQITFDAHSQTGGSMEVRFVNEELLTKEESIQVVNSFFCKLPFRLRLGSRTVYEIKGTVPARMAVINSIDIPNIEAEKKLLGNPPPINPTRINPKMASDVLVTLNPVKIDEDAKKNVTRILKNTDYTKSSKDFHALHVNLEDLLKPINTLIIFYRLLFGEKVQWNRVRCVLRKDISGGHTYALHTLKRQSDSMDFHQIPNSIADATPVSPAPFILGGNLYDMTSEDIAKLQHKLKHETQYAYYSMAFQAQDYMQQTDYLNALLYSVIAFENAHAELIEHIAETKAGCKEARKWAQDLLQRAGISSMVPLTPYLFMKPKDRPSDDTIKGVIRAIQIRNELAHAKKDKKHNLKIDTHRCTDLLPLIEKVFTYINAITRQLPD